MTGVVALRSDRHAITSAVAPPAERYRFEFRRVPQLRHITASIHLPVFHISVWYWLCHTSLQHIGCTCILVTWQQEESSFCLKGNMVLVAINRPVTPTPSSGCRYTSEPECVSHHLIILPFCFFFPCSFSNYCPQAGTVLQDTELQSHVSVVPEALCLWLVQPFFILTTILAFPLFTFFPFRVFCLNFRYLQGKRNRISCFRCHYAANKIWTFLELMCCKI